MKQVAYETLMTAMDVWHRVRTTMKDDEKIGTAVLDRLFELQPKAKNIFGYNISEEVGKSRTKLHAVSFISLVDSMTQLMGPDVEFAETILVQMAAKHKALGVTPALFSYLGDAFVYTFNKQLAECPLADEQMDAWIEFYETITNEIIRNMLNH